MTHDVTVLLIEDEAEIRRFLRTTLPAHGYRLYEAPTGAEGLAQATSRNPDIILLDLGLPDMDGIEVIKQIRWWAAIPILVLSAGAQEQVKVAALDLGADDYVTKPFGMEELLARMRAALRHAARPAGDGGESLFILGDLKVDLGKRQVNVAGNEVHLTPIEYKLLTTLVRHAGRTLTHQQIFREVWGNSYGDAQQYLRVHVRSLRRKIEADPVRPALIVTEPGVGYRFENEP